MGLVSFNTNTGNREEILTISGFVTDTDVIAAITAATYSPTASITPANTRTFYAGQQYYANGILYEAVADNVAYRVTTALPWQEITAAAKGLVSGERYIANNASQIVFTLPPSAAIGSAFSVVGKGAGGFRIGQNAGQSIKMSGNTSTTGTGGFIASNTQYDCVDIICIIADTVFVIRNAQGNLVIT